MDYKKYRLSVKEIIMYVGVWILISSMIAYFFYQSVYAAVLLSLFAPLFLMTVKQKKKNNRDIRLRSEFKEMIGCLSVALEAGESVENAFYGMYSDMKARFGPKAYITKECEIISAGMRNNVSIERLLNNLGERTDVSEISDFAEVFAVAKKSGGSLKEIIGDATESINIKIEMKNDFRVGIVAKKLEQRIMCVIPFAIYAYLKVTSPGYFDPLYEGINGRMIMTGCLLAYVGAFAWGEKILNLKI